MDCVKILQGIGRDFLLQLGSRFSPWKSCIHHFHWLLLSAIARTTGPNKPNDCLPKFGNIWKNTIHPPLIFCTLKPSICKHIYVTKNWNTLKNNHKFVIVKDIHIIKHIYNMNLQQICLINHAHICHDIGLGQKNLFKIWKRAQPNKKLKEWATRHYSNSSTALSLLYPLPWPLPPQLVMPPPISSSISFSRQLTVITVAKNT